MNDLINTSNSALPAHIAKGFTNVTNDDLSAGVSMGFPILSYKGKVWHVVEGDSRDLVANEDGEPLPSVEVVILKANPQLSKTYYRDGYEEGSTEKPVCYSADAIAPAADAAEPQAKKCALCQWNEFGSKVTDNGSRSKACADFRRLAVAPTGDLERAMLVRVPAASLKELVSYADGLKRRNYPYQALVTKIGFDHTVAFPRLTFKSARWLDADEAEIVRDVMERDIIRTITAQTAGSASAQAPVVEDEDELPPPPAHVTKAAPAPEPEAPKAEKPRTAGGFGGAKAKAAEAAPAPEPATEQPASAEPVVLLEGALSQLDAALGGLDDE